MSFEVDAEAYGRFMGAYAALLAPQFAAFAGIGEGQRVLDVGCGPGGLTEELVRRVGADAVSAVDPSEMFVAAARERFPSVDVRQARAERLPYEDGVFDCVLAQLVVHHLADPVVGLREMMRVTRPGGVVAACVWDHGGRRAPLSPLWRAARALDPDVDDESQLPGVQEGSLPRLFAQAGLAQVESGALPARVEYPSVDDWWTLIQPAGGPAGAYLTQLDTESRVRLREQCTKTAPPGPFSLTAIAWAARGYAHSSA